MSNEKIVEATADGILGLRGKVPIEEFQIPGVGIIYIHGFTGLEKGEWQKEVRDRRGIVEPTKVDATMFQMCVRDKNGRQLYQPKDIPKLKTLPNAILSSVVDVCLRLSGMGDSTDAAILKNFVEEEEQPDGSDS